jgi:hypothetical protein
MNDVRIVAAHLKMGISEYIAARLGPVVAQDLDRIAADLIARRHPAPFNGRRRSTKRD